MRIAQSRSFLIILLSQLALMIMCMTNAFASDHLVAFTVSPNDALVYSVHQDDHESFIAVHDTATGTFIKKIPIALVPVVHFKPTLAITPDGKKLYIVDVNKLAYVLNLQTYHLSKIKNKPKQDAGFEYSSPLSMMPDGRHLYVADGVGQLRSPPVIHVIDTATNRVDVAASRKEHYDKGWYNGVAAFNNASSLLYLSRELEYYKFEISIFDTRAHHLMDEVISVDGRMSGMAIHPVSGKLYVLKGGRIEVIDPVTRSVVDTLGLHWTNHTLGMAFALNGNKLYVIDDAGKGKLHIVDTLTRQVHEMEVPVYSNGSWTSDIKSSENGAKVYVSTLDGKILVVDANTDTIIREIF